MTHLQRYAAAALPDSYRIFGVRLRPLSIGHILILTRLGNPLFVSGRQAATEDLILAVAVCSQTWQKNRNSIGRLGWRWCLRWMGLRAMIDRRALWTWSEYVAQSARAPRTWGKAQATNAKRLSSPFWIQVIITLQGVLGYHEDAALDMPIGQAQWLAISSWERDGAAEMASEVEEDVISRSSRN